MEKGIILDINPKTEEGYTQEILDLVNDWKIEIIKIKQQHKKISKSFYIKHILYGIPQVLIPVIMIFITQLDDTEKGHKLTAGLGFLATGIMAGIYNFFQFNVQSEKHDSAHNRYQQLQTHIEYTLTRGIKFRTQSDVFLEYIKTELKNLDLYSPSIDNSCIFHK